VILPPLVFPGLTYGDVSRRRDEWVDGRTVGWTHGETDGELHQGTLTERTVDLLIKVTCFVKMLVKFALTKTAGLN
jgi:hypothetical protein